VKTFALPLTPQAEDIDALGHVNNVVYLRWMQAVAAAHWEAAAPPELRSSVHWVVVRHEIDYKAPAYLGEKLEARTRIGAATAATWERFTEIRRLGDEALLAACRSVYAALDPQTGKPRRLDASLKAPLEG
jgi:acyl-CoA thioester hydrolase